MSEEVSREVNNSNEIDSILLNIICKVSIDNPDTALKLLALCANDDISRESVLNYAIQMINDVDGRYLQ